MSGSFAMVAAGTTMRTEHGESKSARFQQLKGRVHQELLNRLNLDRLTKVSRLDAEPEIRSVIGGILDRESQTTPLSLFERETLTSDVLDELFGLGPLELLLKDPDISDILVNKANQVFIERNGRIEETEIVFRDDKHLMQIIERIRQRRRSPHRRVDSDGRRPPAGRLARQRHHPAAGT
jgi:pilus assembly protein CpaF